MKQYNYFPIINLVAIEDGREEHIAKGHDVSMAEIEEIVDGAYICRESYDNSIALVGRTEEGRYITVILGKRRKLGLYGLITAYPANSGERRNYKEAKETL